ncbi:MAG TPA: type II secretion system protein [Patescibacteria group bacterium]|nr:type II secretion system protein [Patescibacteria group bacterium]
MTNGKYFQKGFTLIELIVSLAILGVIFAISSIVLSTIIPKTSQSNAYDLLISDIKSQQTLAMSTDSNYGIYFEGGSYTLFKGDDFNLGTEKFTVTLDATVTFTDINFPGNTIVFLAGSGDVSGYVSGSDNLNITNAQIGQVKVVRINEYGATY